MTTRLTFPALLLGLSCLLALPQPGLAQKKGTHFIVEGAGGIGFTDMNLTTGFWNASLAYGGKFRSLPMVFYLMASFDHTLYDSSISTSVSSATRDTDDFALMGGLRIYLRISRRLRFFAQGLFGGGFFYTDWVVNGVESYRAKDTGAAGKLSLGLQFRYARGWSVGLAAERMEFWGKDNEAAVAAVTGFTRTTDDGSTTRIVGTFTLHF